MPPAQRARLGPVLLAVVTPLASIFGSGFLIIVPALERTLGPWSVLGIAGVCAVAWVAGTAVRHCVRVVEPRTESGTLDLASHRIDRTSDAVIVVAYVISVALYLRIMAEYVVSYLDRDDPQVAERLVACAAVALIVAIGVLRGFRGLDLLDRFALGSVLILVTLLGGTLLWHDIGLAGDGGLSLPPTPELSLRRTLLVLGGLVISVQGFETIRYLGSEYDGRTRIWASRLAQVIAAVVYVGFVAVVTPVMGLGTNDGPDTTLLDITMRVTPLLTLPLVLAAVFSQLSAAVADTAAAEGNLRGLSEWMRHPRPYLVSGAAAIALAATVPTFTIVAVASRAFAAYYGLQAVLALRTTEGMARKVGFGLLAALMFAITALAQPVG